MGAYYKKATRKNGRYNAMRLSWQSYKTRVGGRIQGGGESSAAISEYKVARLRREAWLCFHLIGLIETRRMSVKCISTGCHAELLNSSDLLIYSTFAQLWKLLHVIYIYAILCKEVYFWQHIILFDLILWINLLPPKHIWLENDQSWKVTKIDPTQEV